VECFPERVVLDEQRQKFCCRFTIEKLFDLAHFGQLSPTLEVSRPLSAIAVYFQNGLEAVAISPSCEQLIFCFEEFVDRDAPRFGDELGSF
jgi:hypothetical protein